MSQNIAQILLQSLNKKNQILDDIIRENEQQEQILKQDTLDMDALEASLDRMILVRPCSGMPWGKVCRVFRPSTTTFPTVSSRKYL